MLILKGFLDVLHKKTIKCRNENKPLVRKRYDGTLSTTHKKLARYLHIIIMEDEKGG